MAITRTYVGLNSDGSPHYGYESDGHVVVTGPIYGTVTTGDGVSYDVSDSVIEVQTPAHAVEVARLVGERHAAQGHPTHTDGAPFTPDPGGPDPAVWFPPSGDGA